MIDRLRTKFVDVPDLEARVVRPVLFSSKTPIEVEVSGQDLDKVKLLGDQAAEAMAALPELADVESTLQAGAPEVQILYDRERLSRYGLNIGQVARLVRDKVKGNEATRFNLKDRRVPILVRLAMDDRETVETCGRPSSTPAASGRFRSRRWPTSAWAKAPARCVASRAAGWR